MGLGVRSMAYAAGTGGPLGSGALGLV
jgi:hypothetical protein